MSPSPRWVSATDLAEYAFCPRSLYYRRRDPDAPETPAETDGRQYHARVLGAERRRAERGGAYWLGVLAGGVLLTVGVVGVLHP
ncbi:MAG: hypothetical protein WAK40_02050 [Thermoplasmata archaeon]